MDLLVVAQDAVETASGQSQTAEVVLFWILAVVGIGSGFAVVAMRNIVHGALMLVLNFLAISGMYLLLQSGFLSIVQVIVYAGAIMVLFLFVIMLLGVDRDDALIDIDAWHRVGAGLVGLAVVAGVTFSVVGAFTTAGSRCGDQIDSAVLDARDDAVRCVGLDDTLEQADGSVEVVANRLFGRFTFPFEASALLLTVATIGAIVLGRRGDEDDEGGPADVAPSDTLPDPGTDAVDEDVPLVDPDAEVR